MAKAALVSSATLIDVLRLRARESTDVVAYVHLADGTFESRVSITYGALWRRAVSVAAQVRTVALPGDLVALAIRPGLDYVVGLFGIMLAGVTVVPTFPPSNRRAAERLAAILRDCAPNAVMMDAGHSRSSLPADLPVLEIEDAGAADEFEFTPAEPAVLQYTSGSTAEPKGIKLGHTNLVSNCTALDAHIGQEPDRVGLTWLPPYHDMGLVGTILFAMHGGWPLVMMDPEHFVQAPARWLRAVGEFGVTITVAPAFALKLCTDSVSESELAEIDLSGLRQMFCGSEPIHPDVIAEFVVRFGRAGLSPTALIPCYGLAEATLFVTGKRPGEQLRVEDGVVSCGHPAVGHEVFVVDPDTGERRRDGQVGEIWVRGPNVGAGYFGDDFEAGTMFQAGPNRDALRTGDLGWMRDGELFVTGRINGLIVVAGRNLYPQDVEATVNTCHRAVFCSVAISFPGATGEELIILAERRTSAELDEAREAIVVAVSAAHGVRPKAVEFVGIGHIPRTTSGKLRRAEARRHYLGVAT